MLLSGLLAVVACADGSVISPPAASRAAPTITELAVASVAASDATIVWSTSQPTMGSVAYGTTTAYGSVTATGSTAGMRHEVTLSDLRPATTYHYRVTVQDRAGTLSVSADDVFTTAEAPPEPLPDEQPEPPTDEQPEPPADEQPEPPTDEQPPTISRVAITAVGAEIATIAWSTDEPTVGSVRYGTTVGYGSASAVESIPGAEHEVTIFGLQPGLTYHYRVAARDTAENVSLSDDAIFTTDVAPQPAPRGAGIWISPVEIADLPTTGSAWESLLAEANGSCGIVDLSDQEQDTNVCVMAKALVFARTGEPAYRTDVVTALTQIVEAPLYVGRALALGRELAAYVIAADLIDLSGHDPLLDVLFRTTIRTLLTTYTQSGPDDLAECHELRPNNWGTHCGASRAAVAAYLGDTAELDRVARVFRGWLGERDSYADFGYGDLSWQCEGSRPVPINAAGCTRDGYPIDGVLPDDQRRAGTFIWPAPKEEYVWEALQGALVQAVILYRAGYPVWDWGDRALLRAMNWLHVHGRYPAEGDDTWQPHVVNHYYGTSFPAPTPARPGKNVGWTDWTHR